MCTVFPQIVSEETIIFESVKCGNFHIISALWQCFINWIVVTETIKEGKLFKGGNYLQKYGILLWGYQTFKYPRSLLCALCDAVEPKLSWKLSRASNLLFCIVVPGSFSFSLPRTTDAWWPKFSTTQNLIPIPSRKSCKMYENLSCLQKKWPSNAKSLTRDTVTKNTSKRRSSHLAKIFGINCLGYLKKNYHWVSMLSTIACCLKVY